jgi:hypothetical protein
MSLDDSFRGRQETFVSVDESSEKGNTATDGHKRPEQTGTLQ